MNSNKFFWWFTTIVFCGLLLPFLVQASMFLDGVSYAAIGNNLANGVGTFWQPHYTETYAAEFYRHPPLAFGIQSLFYKVLGDGMYVERIYSFTCAFLTGTGIALLWRLFQVDSESKNKSWLPVLLWISVPLTFWAYSNNILENTMSVFAIFSVYTISKALLEKKWYWLIAGAGLIILAFLTKGFVGLFPLIAPLLFGIAYQSKFKLALLYNLLLVLFASVAIAILFVLIPDAKMNTFAYVKDQLLPALENADTTTSNRFKILPELLLELAFPLVLIGLFYLRKRIKKQPFNWINKQEAIYFLLIGLAASLPIIISLKQRKFYMMPSVAYFVLGASFIINSQLDSFLIWMDKKKKWFLTLNVGSAILVLSLCWFNFGHYSKDADKWHDVRIIADHVNEDETISTSKALWGDWGLHAYLSRTNHISIDCDRQHQFYLIEKEDKNLGALSEQYQKIELELLKYELLEKH
jgi:4-amino-4-deoxy-L-arabinose transferase-like glycosyltransferase